MTAFLPNVNFPFDYYLSVDADIGFTPEHLLQLLNKDSYTVDEAAVLAVDMLDQLKILVSGFHKSLKEAEEKLKKPGGAPPAAPE